jgi:8-oxo-dGTP diphosphatase
MYKHTHVGVYGIAFNNGQVLLVEKQRGPYSGKWDLPGGGIENGENSIETLTREFGEECGHKVLESKLIEVLNNRIEYVNSEKQLEELTLVSIIYLVSVEEYERTVKDRIILDTEDVSDFRWVGISEVEILPLTPIATFFTKWIEKNND